MWIARSEDGFLSLFKWKPSRELNRWYSGKGYWDNGGSEMQLTDKYMDLNKR